MPLASFPTVNNRGQYYCHKRIYRSGAGERQIIRFRCGNGLQGNPLETEVPAMS